MIPLLIVVFVVGYLAIAFEHTLKLNKAAPALLCGVLCWTVYISGRDEGPVLEMLAHHLGDIAGILFFLLGAMVIVELIDAHDGFELITQRIRTTNRRRLLVTVALLTFFLSAVLDNLTTSIVMMSLVRKLMTGDEDRMRYGGVVIIAANAGGAWSPIGDVTTTMLWVGGNISAGSVVRDLFFPSVVSLLVPVLWIAFRMKGDIAASGRESHSALRGWLATVDERAVSGERGEPVVLPAGAAAIGKTLTQLNLRARSGAWVASIVRDDILLGSSAPREPLRENDELTIVGEPDAFKAAVRVLISNESAKPTTAAQRAVVFFAGVGVLLFVPVFKLLTHLPPFMGILLGLGLLWTLTEILHKKTNDEARSTLSVAGALQRVDSQSVLFFLGILLAIGALEASGLLSDLALGLDRWIGNEVLITLAIGVSSSIVDNVPLVAAARGMYPLATYPADHTFWHFLAYCAGTGGSILIIGSAAGIAVMGIQRISFGWYVRNMTFAALLGYVAGALAYLGQGMLR